MCLCATTSCHSPCLNLLVLRVLSTTCTSLSSTYLHTVTVAEGPLGVFVCLRCLQLFACEPPSPPFVVNRSTPCSPFVWFCGEHIDSCAPNIPLLITPHCSPESILMWLPAWPTSTVRGGASAAGPCYAPPLLGACTAPRRGCLETVPLPGARMPSLHIHPTSPPPVVPQLCLSVCSPSPPW